MRELSGDAANFTFTAADAAGGLVPFLNKVAGSSPYRWVHIRLPSGTVQRGSGSLVLPAGLMLVLEGQGKDGAGETTLNLAEENLDLGSTRDGANGRWEFRRMHLTNVRLLPSPVVTARSLRTTAAVRAGLCKCSVKL